MKKVYIFPNKKKDTGLKYTREVVHFLQKQGIAVYGDADWIEEVDGVSLLEPEEKSSMDLAVILGGDGTILMAAHFLLQTGVPILGINLGTLGYMAEVEPESINQALCKLLDGQYRIEERMILEGVLTNLETGQVRTVHAVNDFSLHRSDMAGVLDIRTYIDDIMVENFRADGVIVCTPNGSTAYNFSAGGPIVSPRARNIVLTPLCNHSILDRSIVLTGEDKLSLEVGRREDDCHPLLNVDGVEKIRLEGAARFDVRACDLTFPLIRVSNMNFFEVLRTKMND